MVKPCFPCVRIFLRLQFIVLNPTRNLSKFSATVPKVNITLDFIPLRSARQRETRISIATVNQ